MRMRDRRGGQGGNRDAATGGRLTAPTLMARCRWGRCLLVAAILAAAILVVYLWPGPFVAQGPVAAPAPVPRFRHVFVIMMENHSPAALLNPSAPDPYIRHLIATEGYDSDYFGVTHPSLPNYVAALSGQTQGSHSDSPTQRFAIPNLALQLDHAHISWQAVMQSLPYAGYTGNWYPDSIPHAAPTTMPVNALYAKKHDPFLLFPAVARVDAGNVVPLATLGRELASGSVPSFVWISPNLCEDMHGEPNTKGATCPQANGSALIADGNAFLATWIARIMQSSAWGPGSVIFVTWDEGSNPANPSPSSIHTYKAAGPAAPPIFSGAPWLGVLGGGSAPLIVIAPHLRPTTVHLWADHYSLLKTLEASWHLPYLGHAASRRVPLLTPLLP